MVSFSTVDTLGALTCPPVSNVLDQLFAVAERFPSPLLKGLTRSELVDLFRETDDYRAFYHELETVPLPITRRAGLFLYSLVCSTKPRTIVEFGTSFGVSTVYMAAALQTCGSRGRIITTECEPYKVARARATLEAAGVSDLVEIREGDAVETLASDLPDEIDFVLLDGAKRLYCEVLGLLEPSLASGAVVFADDADVNFDYLPYVRSKTSGYLSSAFADTIEVSIRQK